MSEDGDRQPPTRSQDSLLLVCRKCGKEEEHTVASMFALLTTGWPECCGEQMAFQLKLNWPGESPGGTLPGIP
jgi:hypothetical protein